jgi:hypothetical protein
VNIFAEIILSEVLAVEDSVALSKNLVPLGSQVELLSQIAHIKKFFVVFLEKSNWSRSYIGESIW